MNKAQIRRFRRFLRQFERATSLQLKNCCTGVTLAQCLVLLETEELDRPTVGSLASQLRLDNSTLSRTIDGLVQQGLLDRSRDQQDRRVVWIRLTAEGKALCRAIHDENDAYCRRVFEQIPSQRREPVAQHFETLVQAFLECEADSK